MKSSFIALILFLLLLPSVGFSFVAPEADNLDYDSWMLLDNPGVSLLVYYFKGNDLVGAYNLKNGALNLEVSPPYVISGMGDKVGGLTESAINLFVMGVLGVVCGGLLWFAILKSL